MDLAGRGRRDDKGSHGDFLRETSIVVVTLETSEFYIVVSLSTRNDTQVIYVDPTSGALSYHDKLGHDLFHSEREAVDYITDGSSFKSIYARGIIGYSALGSVGLLLVATKLTATIPTLPGGGCVYTVTESQCIQIPLQNPLPQGKGELKNIQELAEYDIDGKHYFCETRDITRPFPSSFTLLNPDDEFVWNGWLSKPFEDIGLQQHCVILLQGFAESRNFGGSGQQAWMVALIARRSRLHPGTRYLARGMNACNSTGNEVECEQLVWISQNPRQNLHFSTYVWRRGTIPMWWGAELKLTAAEAEIYVSPQDPYRGSLQYYQRLSRRYCARNADVAVVNHKKKKLVPITCVNLLRNGEGKSESVLVEHFVESLNCIRSSGNLPYAPLHLINYDWHATVKLRGEQQTIEGLWRHLKNPTLTVGFSEGSYFPSKQALQGCKGVLVPDDNFGDGFCLRSCQNGVIRFNCADSLDRTNAASFFGALQVFVEQCRRLGINLDQDAIYGFSSSNYSEPNNVGLYTGPLPPGWEERTDAVTGKIFYINHNTRTTTWEHPCPDKPWKRFNMTFEQFKSSTISYPITQLADLFLLAGDIHATLYTGSKAMHSQILNIFNTDTGKFNKFSAAQNMKITLQRRYQNVVVDSSRQKQLEMFLGIRLFKHLPSVSIHPLQVLSRPSSCLLKPVSHMFPSASGEPNLLSFKKKNVTWVCSPATDVVELFIYLEEPCHVCQLLITVAQGAEDTSTPGRFPERLDVRTGCNLDGLKLVLEGACLPQCANGTNIVIPLMGAISSEDLAITGSGARLNAEESSSSLLYDFEELEGELNFLTRVVALTFYPAVPNGTPMVLGEVEVLGVSLPWTGIFAKKGAGKNFIELVQMLPKATKGFVPGSDFRPSTNPFLCGPDTDQHSTFVPSESVSRAEPGFDNLGLDLLTGDISFPHSTSQSELSGAAVSQSGGILDVFEESVTEDSYSAQDSNLPTMLHEESSTTNTGVQHYLDCLKYFQNKGYKLDFVEAMKLEIERLRINLSAAERDRVLLSAGIVPATLDPNLLLEDTYLATICKYANVLAFLAQSAFEDKINSSIGLENVDNEAIDFWNVDSFGDNCYGGMCEVREVEQLSFQLPTAVPSTGSSLLMLCSHCERKACRVCCAGKGAVLLANYILKERKSMYGSSGQTGSSHGSKSEGLSVSNDGILCKSCCDDIILHVLYVDYVRVMNSLRRRVRADNAAKESLDQVLGSGVNNTYDTYQDIDTGRKQLNKLLNGEESLAEFPFASMLYSVETAVGSDPPLSLLAPLGTGTRHSYWKAPPSCSRVEFSIVLGSLSDVSGVMLLISSCGYSATDCPIVQIWASNKINREERSCMGKWDVRSLAASSSELYGPENACGKKNILRHVKFLFNNSVRCRIIWIMLTLPLAASNSVNLDRDFNLLSLDDGSFVQPYRHGSFREGAGNSPCIHAKRLIVLGRAITKDPSLQGSDRVNVRSWSERSSPPLSRFKVPVEAERLSGNDLILEQYLLPSAPGIAGFRVDVLNVIKPRITHSPAASDSDIWQSSLTCLEDRHISPAVLYIHVSIVQESRKRVTLGTYRLPEARVGTPLYFDFSRPIQCRVITFKLLGDIAAFADDPAEQGEFDIKASALASGLSLSNRIKLYYYGNPYELGKLAALNAV